MKKLASTTFSKHIVLENGILNNIVIENKNLYNKFVMNLQNQLINNEGNILTLSESNKILDLSKYAYLITDLFSLRTDDKSSTNTLYKYVDREILDDNLFAEFNEVIAKIGDFVDQSKAIFDFDIDFDLDLKISSIYKMVNVSAITREDLFVNKLIDFIKFQYLFSGKEIFLILNLKLYFDETDISILIEELSKIGISIINVTTLYIRDASAKSEFNIVIDNDLCEII